MRKTTVSDAGIELFVTDPSERTIRRDDSDLNRTTAHRSEVGEFHRLRGSIDRGVHPVNRLTNRQVKGLRKSIRGSEIQKVSNVPGPQRRGLNGGEEAEIRAEQ